MYHLAPHLGLSGRQALQSFATGGTAVSDEAGRTRKVAAWIAAMVERSQALSGRTADALAALGAVARDCAEPDWDGYGAAPIDPAAVALARQFLRVLPDELPMPEVAADPDGAVSLDWVQARYRSVSISINAGGRLSYAWLDGTDRGHGVARFDGRSVPPRIADEIRKISGAGDAGLRAA